MPALRRPCGHLGDWGRGPACLEQRPGFEGLLANRAGEHHVRFAVGREAGAGTWQTLVMPEVPPVWAPILYAIPAQLLAYHTAIAKGTDVDQPRNLAKSVTVE